MKQEISLEKGKYKIVLDDEPTIARLEFLAFRFDQPWRNLVGDKMIFAMFNEILALKKTIGDSVDRTKVVLKDNSMKDFHVGYWMTPHKLSGINVSAVDMTAALQSASTDHAIDPSNIIYVHLKESSYKDFPAENQ